MDTLTHGLLGALTIRSLPERYKNISLHEITILGFIAAVFPDIDYLMFWIHPLQFLAEWHRAATHSLVMMPVWSIVLGFLAAIVVKARWKWPVYTIVSAIAITTHIISDTITIYGTQIFNPVSDYKAVIGTTFVIDGYFTGIVTIGLTGSILMARYRIHYHKLFVTLIFCFLFSYLGLQLYLRSLADDYANYFVVNNKLQSLEVHSLPQPFSPTYWKIIVETGNDYWVSFVNVMPAEWHKSFTLFMAKLFSGNSDTIIKSVSNYLPVQIATWASYSKIESEGREILNAWNQDEFSAFRKFAVFPVLYRKDSDVTGDCIWFTDLRYVFPVMIPPFRYGMCGKADKWTPYRLERYTLDKRVRI